MSHKFPREKKKKILGVLVDGSFLSLRQLATSFAAFSGSVRSKSRRKKRSEFSATRARSRDSRSVGQPGESDRRTAWGARGDRAQDCGRCPPYVFRARAVGQRYRFGAGVTQRATNGTSRAALSVYRAMQACPCCCPASEGFTCRCMHALKSPALTKFTQFLGNRQTCAH